MSSWSIVGVESDVVDLDRAGQKARCPYPLKIGQRNPSDSPKASLSDYYSLSRLICGSELASTQYTLRSFLG